MFSVSLERRTIVFGLTLIGVFLYTQALADAEGQLMKFFVNSDYDASERSQITAVLEEISNKAYFYIEKDWLDNLSDEQRQTVVKNIEVLAKEFDQKIYPTITSFYGREWSPGIDNDTRITILFSDIKKDVAGYFNEADEYDKVQSPHSNEREMIYLNANNIFYDIVKSHIAHEFVHLITFNQKVRLRGVEESVWLNEGRADFAPTIMGYDVNFQGSNLQERVKIFLSNPSDSLTIWENQKKDYGVVAMVMQYINDHYTKNVIRSSIFNSFSGVSSINKALSDQGINKTLKDIFKDWVVSVFLADCNVDELYCYKNESLKNIKVVPSLIFLPSTQRTQVSLHYLIRPWSGNWFRILGKGKDLKINFDGEDDGDFSLEYVLCKNTHQCEVKEVQLDKFKRGEINLNNFSKKWNSITLLPVVFSSEGVSRAYGFSLNISLIEKSEQEEIKELLERIDELKKKIAELQARLSELVENKSSYSCSKINSNLFLGSKGNEVRCLQEFLRSQGSDIYPEGLVTGYFGPLTYRAVLRFQKKYAPDILLPLNLKKATGIVGPLTRKKINEFLISRKINQ